MYNIPPSGAGKPGHRPDLLTVLCILTFIGSGLGAFSNLVMSLSYDMIKEMAESGEMNFPGMDIYLSLPRSFYVVSFVVMFASLFGALQMWKLRKFGFHVYTIAQLLLLLLPTIYMPRIEYPFLNIFITATFVLLYAVNLKHMS